MHGPTAHDSALTFLPICGGTRHQPPCMHAHIFATSTKLVCDRFRARQVNGRRRTRRPERPGGGASTFVVASPATSFGIYLKPAMLDKLLPCAACSHHLLASCDATPRCLPPCFGCSRLCSPARVGDRCRPTCRVGCSVACCDAPAGRTSCRDAPPPMAVERSRSVASGTSCVSAFKAAPPSRAGGIHEHRAHTCHAPWGRRVKSLCDCTTPV